MTNYSMESALANDVFPRLVRELQAEFYFGDVEALAKRIVESEAADFHWDARLKEHYLGQHFAMDFDGEGAGEELARMAILSFLHGHWHAGTCLVDGDGDPVEMLWVREFSDRDEAEMAFVRAR